MYSKGIATLYDSEIALFEHELLNECEISDWRPEDFQMYALGVQNMANKIIQVTRKKEDN